MFTPFRLFILCPMLGVIMIFNNVMNSRPITNRTRASQCYQSPKINEKTWENISGGWLSTNFKFLLPSAAGVLTVDEIYEYGIGCRIHPWPIFVIKARIVFFPLSRKSKKFWVKIWHCPPNTLFVITHQMPFYDI